MTTRGRWLAFAVWALVVFGMVPFANGLQRWVHQELGPRALFYGLVAALVVGVGVAFRWLSTHRPQQLWTCLAWIVVVSSLIGAWGWVLRNAAGTGHLAAFSILSALAFRALRPRLHDAGIYLAATALTAVVGTVDELLQWLTPGRFWDLADLGVNAGTAALIQLLIWKGIRPVGLRTGVSARSWRTVARWLLVETVLILACLANTPERIAGYAERVPGLAYLGKDRSTRMLEYGHLLTDPEIGRFRSRKSREELARLDREHGAEAADVLRRYRRPEDRAELSKAYPPWRDPLVFEMREHLTLRNRERRKMLQNLGSDVELGRDHATAAFREQLILERYFGTTFGRFVDGLDAAAREQLRTLQRPDAAYDSAASAWLTTGFSEAGACGALTALLVLLAAVERYADRAHGRTPLPEPRGA
jgi:hypothetical protein